MTTTAPSAARRSRACCRTPRFLCSIARGLQVQRAEIEAQRRANEGHRVMVVKLREELQRTNEKYVDLRRRTLEEIQNLLEKGTET